MGIEKALTLISSFQGESLTKKLAAIETDIIGANAKAARAKCSEQSINSSLMKSALEVKKAARQINVIIHATGILHALCSLLKEGEIVESVSLGAGNTGRKFDLETNLQIAEFKFIDWQGGSETIRQNGLFKDFYELAEFETTKDKCLYVLGRHYPLKFLSGNRGIKSVLAKQPEILNSLQQKYQGRVLVAGDYYQIHKDNVCICDVSPYIGRA